MAVEAFAILAGGRSRTIPTDTEAIAIGAGLRFLRMEGLVHQGGTRSADEIFEEDRTSLVGEEAAHGLRGPAKLHCAIYSAKWVICEQAELPPGRGSDSNTVGR